MEYKIIDGYPNYAIYKNGEVHNIKRNTILKFWRGRDQYATVELSKNNIETIEKSIITTCNYQKLENLCSVSLTAVNFSRYILGNLMIQMSKRISSLQFP